MVQSVVYLEGLQQLYAAQLRVLGGLVLKGAGSETSDIVAIAPDGSQNTIIDYPGENITKMVPFKAIDGKEYLLMAGRRGDRIIRLDPISLDSRDLVTGINGPTALAFDGNGNLVVAVTETPPIRTIPRRVLGEDLSPVAGLEQRLHVGTNSIFDVRALADLTSLDFLELRANVISDISAPAALTALQVLDLTSNSVFDLTSLAKLGNLERLEVAENAVQDLDPLASLSKLSELRLRGNNISVVAPLSDLTNLNFVDLQGNPLNQGECTIISGLEEDGVQVVKDIDCN